MFLLISFLFLCKLGEGATGMQKRWAMGHLQRKEKRHLIVLWPSVKQLFLNIPLLRALSELLLMSIVECNIE